MKQKKVVKSETNMTLKKMPDNLCCKICSFKGNKKSNLELHLLTKKHLKKAENETPKKGNETKKNADPLHYVCESCEYCFNSRTTLWRHRKKCHKGVIEEKSNSKVVFCCEKCDLTFNSKLNLIRHKKKCNKSDENNLSQLIQENLSADKSTSADKLLTLLPKLTDAIIKMTERPTHVNNNCNNKMTINMYLNEECKNAMNLTDFINQMKVSLEDLMYTQQHGYVKGISNIFVKQLQDMDPKDRPIHCSDKKRMQFYVKEEDKW